MSKELIYPDYNNCVTNLACSILKHFGIEHSNNTLEILDNKLKEKSYKNILVIIYDGMGSELVKTHLAEDSFLRSHMISEITSMLPSSTVPATTALKTGLNPCESGYTGWDIYIEELDEIITVYRDKIKDTDINTSSYQIEEEFLPYKSVAERINESNDYAGYALFPFGENKHESLEDMTQRIIDISKQDGQKYIYAYYDRSDKILHYSGTKHSDTKELINKLNSNSEYLAGKLEDTLIIISADHGHIDVEKIYLKQDYPELTEMLERNTGLEGRACAFWVKEDKKEEFADKFNTYFGEDFILLSKEEALEKNLFSDSPRHKNFEASIGDYIALATSNKHIIYDKNFAKSHIAEHGGITKDEMIVPLIVISR